jgi:hypothetical protein
MHAARVDNVETSPDTGTFDSTGRLTGLDILVADANCPICLHDPNGHDADGCKADDEGDPCSCTATPITLSLDRYRYLR